MRSSFNHLGCMAALTNIILNLLITFNDVSMAELNIVATVLQVQFDRIQTIIGKYTLLKHFDGDT